MRGTPDGKRYLYFIKEKNKIIAKATQLSYRSGT